MLVVPKPAKVTRPAAFTVAIEVFADTHVIERPMSTAPLASFGVAVSCAVLPMLPFAVAGVTWMEATGAGDDAIAVMLASPTTPSLVAVMLVAPVPVNVTRPVAFTTATEVFALDHVIERPVSTVPLAFFVVATIRTVSVTLPLVDGGVTVTIAT